MTNEELVDLIQSGENIKQNMAELYQQNRNYIYKIALPYSKSCEMDDLMQEAYFGLVEAVDHFDPDQGFKFITYMPHWIKLKIHRYVENCGRAKRISSSELQLMSKYQKFKRDFRNYHDGEPTEADYMKHLDISKRRLNSLEKYIYESSCQSMDAALPGTDDITLGDAIADDFNLEEDVTDRIATEQTQAVIWACVGKLDSRQQNIIESRYKRNMSLTEVSKVEAVTAERVRQIERKAIITLKKEKQIQAAADFYGYGCRHAFHYSLQKFKDTRTSSTEFIALRRLEIEEQLGEKLIRERR